MSENDERKEGDMAVWPALSLSLPAVRWVSWAHFLCRTLGMVLKTLGKTFIFPFRTFGAFFSI